MKNTTGSEFWDRITVKGDYQNRILRDYMTLQYEHIIRRWVGYVRDKSILKTDMYEEAFHDKSVLELFMQRNKITGMDISKLVIHKVKENPNLNFINRLKAGNRKNKIFRKSEFDIVLSLSTLDHLPKSELLPALENINYELKDDGVLILSLNNRHNPFFRIIHKMDSIFRLKFPSNFYSAVETKKILTNAGFDVLKEDYIIFIPPFFRVFTNLAEKIGFKALNRCVHLVANHLNVRNRFLKKFFSYYFILYAKKSVKS